MESWQTNLTHFYYNLYWPTLSSNTAWTYCSSFLDCRVFSINYGYFCPQSDGPISSKYLSRNHSNSSDIGLSLRLYSLFPSTLFFQIYLCGDWPCHLSLSSYLASITKSSRHGMTKFTSVGWLKTAELDVSSDWEVAKAFGNKVSDRCFLSVLVWF